MKNRSSHLLLNTSRSFIIRLKSCCSQAVLQRWQQRITKHTDGLTAEPVPGFEHRYSPQAMPRARWLLPPAAVVSIQSYNKQQSFKRKHSFPLSRATNKLTADLIFKDLELIGIEKQALRSETGIVKPNN